MELGQGDGRSIKARVNTILEETRKRIEGEVIVDLVAEHAHAQTQMMAAGIDAILQVRDQLDKFERAVARQAITNQEIAEEVRETRKMVTAMEERAAKRDAEAVEEMRSIRMEIETRGEYIRASLDAVSMSAERAAVAAEQAASAARGVANR